MYISTLSNRVGSVKRAPTPAYVPVAARVGLGFRSAYVVPSPRPNMAVLFAYEAMRNVLAWWTATYQAVGVHGRNGGVVVSAYARRRAVRGEK